MFGKQSDFGGLLSGKYSQEQVSKIGGLYKPGGTEGDDAED